MLSCEELRLRAALFAAVRAFFQEQGFLEVDTPVLQPVIIPEGNIIPLRAEKGFLQTSPEAYMKRLLAAGCENIFQICPCFRSEERGRRHLEEFTMLEWYRRGETYGDLMRDCEGLLQGLRTALLPLLPSIPPLSASWQQISVADAFERYSPVALKEALARDSFDEILVEYIEPRLGQMEDGMVSPVFLCDYPSSMASLARLKTSDDSLAERFELYIDGVEIANGFTELTDSCEQRARFVTELHYIEETRGEEYALPERFLKALDQIGGAAGIALGLDRLFMLILGKEDINDAVSFSPLDAEDPRRE